MNFAGPDVAGVPEDIANDKYSMKYKCKSAKTNKIQFTGHDGHGCKPKNVVVDQTYQDDAITYETDKAHQCTKCGKDAPCPHMAESCNAWFCPGEECPDFCENTARDLWVAFSEGNCSNTCGNGHMIK